MTVKIAAFPIAVLALAAAAGAGCKPPAPATKDGLPSSPASEAQKNPFPGAKLFVDPQSPARQQAAAWQASRAADAALVEKIASQPQADWFTSASADPKAAADARVSSAAAAGALPVLVLQVGPACGGLADDAYKRWVQAFSDGIGDRPAVVIFEPGALRGVDECKTPQEKQQRIRLLHDGVIILTARTKTAVYIEAGGSKAMPAEAMALRLMKAGVERARGFALNVAGFGRAEDEVAYGKQLSKLARSRPFVVDTSRSGQGPATDGATCNPPDRGLGPAPTTSTGDPLVDAYLWIKRPGTSDGTCNGGPAPGEWWPEAALVLARNAIAAASSPPTR